MTIVKVIHRIGFKSGNYIAKVENEKITTTFEKEEVAKSTFKAMEAAKMDIKILQYDGKKTIIQVFPGKKEAQLLEQVKSELDNAIKNKYFIQKILYTIEKEEKHGKKRITK